MTKSLSWKASLLLASASVAQAAPSGVSTDGSLGAKTTLKGPKFIIPADLGTQRGGNLFHSFSQFDLAKGDLANFTGPAQIKNILARVTSGKASSIDGTISSDIPQVNLFLLNPSGVMFGPNASVNLGGSFTTGTPDFLKLAGGGKFNTSLGGDDNLTSAPVTAFGFLSQKPASVSLRGTTLEGKGITLLGGNLTLDNATLSAPGGNLNLFSAKGPGETSIDPARYRNSTVSRFGKVTLKNNSTVSIDSVQGGGKVAIRGGKLVMQDASLIHADNLGVNPGGSIDIMSESLTLSNGSGIETRVLGSGSGGAVSIENRGALRLQKGGHIDATTEAGAFASAIDVKTGTLAIDGLIDGDHPSGIHSKVLAGSKGGGGSITVQATGAISISDGGSILAETLSTGQAAEVSVQARSLTIDNLGAPDVFSGIGSFATAGKGGGGAVSVDVFGTTSIRNAGEIAANTFSKGDAGSVHLHSGSLLIDGTGSPKFVTGIDSVSANEATGQGGSILVEVDRGITILGAGGISASTFTSGDAGDVTIHAGSLHLDGSATPEILTGIVSNSNSEASGDGGTVIVDIARDISLRGAAIIATNTYSSGKAGDVLVGARSLTIDGIDTPGQQTGISSLSGPGAHGLGGTVFVDVSGALTIANSGTIAADTYSSQRAGDLAIHAGTMTLDGLGPPDLFTGISSNSFRGIEATSGDGGSLFIKVDRLLTIQNGAQIAANTFSTGNSGSIQLKAGSLTIDGKDLPAALTGISSASGSSAMGNGGRIQMEVARQVSLFGGGSISVTTQGGGDAGVIFMQAGSLLIDGKAKGQSFTGFTSTSEASASGKGGSIDLEVGGDIQIFGGGNITANTRSIGNAGTIKVSASNLLLDGSDSTQFVTGISSSCEPGAGGNGGSIVIDVANQVFIAGSATISADTFSAGNAGTINLTSGSLVINGSVAPGITTGITSVCQPNALGTGNGGSIVLNVGGDVLLYDAGTIATTTYSNGDAGSISLNAGSLTIDGLFALDYFTGINSSSEPGASGKGGNLEVNVAGNMVIRAGGVISADTFSTGDAGAIVVNGQGNLLIDGVDALGYLTAISSVANRESGGDGSSVTLNIAGDVSLLDSGKIAASTFSTGKAGDIVLHAGTLTIDGTNGDRFLTGVVSGSSFGAHGDGGTVTVDVSGEARILGGGQILANTSSAGNAGSVLMTAGALTIDGTSRTDSFTGISTSSEESATGHGGEIEVRVGDSLSILNAGGINATTFSSGRAGNVVVQADSLTIDGSGGNGAFTGISSDSDFSASGNGGRVTVQVDHHIQLLEQGFISAKTFSSGSAGNVKVQAETMTITGSIDTVNSAGITSSSEAGATGNGGTISVRVRDGLQIYDGGTISADAFDIGNAGDVVVHAGSLTVDGLNTPSIETGISSSCLTGAQGNGGNVSVCVGHEVLILSSGSIDANTFGEGNAGSVELHAGSLSIDGYALPESFTGITSGCEPNSGGNGGTVTVRVARGLAIYDGGTIAANTFGEGNAGDVDVQAGSLTIDGRSGVAFMTGITSGTDIFAEGQGGKVQVNAGNITILGGGQISASTRSLGNAGDVVVHADGILIDGTFSGGHLTGIASLADFFASGNGGTVSVTAHDLQVVNGGQISASTDGFGDAGDVAVQAGSLRIDGASLPDVFTGITSGATVNSFGKGGQVAVNVGGTLEILNAGQISSSTGSVGQGGQVFVAANQLNLSTAGSINAQATGEGAAGTVQVTAQNLTMNQGGVISSSSTGPGVGGSVVIQGQTISLDGGSSISATAGQSTAGSIAVTASDSLTMKGNSAITTVAGKNGGNINLNVGQLVYLLDSSILSSAQGNGGNITIDPRFVVLDNSLISANASQGQGGNITIVANYFFRSNTPITATGSTNGTVTISTPSLDLSGSLLGLSGALVDNTLRLEESCTQSLTGATSSFTVTSQGGSPLEPNELLIDLPSQP